LEREKQASDMSAPLTALFGQKIAGPDVEPGQQQLASGPRRHDVLFASLFKPNVFPHFFRVFVKCDIDLPSATAHTAPASDSGTSIAITDEGFMKMAECCIVCNSGAYSSENLSTFLSSLKSNKDKKIDDFKSAAEFKSAEAQVAAQAQPNPQDHYSEKFLAFVLLSLSQCAKAADEAQAVGEFSADMASVLLTMPKLDRTDAFFSFCAWLLNHCTIPHQSTEPTSDQPSPHQCRAETVIHNFASDPDPITNPENLHTWYPSFDFVIYSDSGTATILVTDSGIATALRPSPNVYLSFVIALHLSVCSICAPKRMLPVRFKNA
jgi:hypothetical protein